MVYQGHIRVVLFQFSVLFCLLASVLASGSHNHHRHHHGLHHKSSGHADELLARSSLNTTGHNSSSNDPQELIKQALVALSVVNKARLDHPYFNNLELANSSSLERTVNTAPPLDYALGGPGQDHARKRELNSTSKDARKSYSIPQELVDAARIVAESTSQFTAGDQPEIAAQIRKKYALIVNDTNVPQQKLIHPDGLLGYEPFNAQDIASNETTSHLESRQATSGYWMGNLPQRGISPFAPQGYKVSTNAHYYVKYYSHGRRCGEMSKTTVPKEMV